MPKVIPDAVKDRVLELLREDRTGREVSEILAGDGIKISHATVSAIARDHELERPAGARPGVAHRPYRYSKNRAKAKKLAADGVPVVEIARRLKISKQAVYKLLKPDEQ